MNLKISQMFAFLFALSFLGSSHASLIGVLAATPGGTDYQAYYDDVADLTWLQDANAAGAGMSWSSANTWVAGLDVDGVTGWRLPDALNGDGTGPCLGYSCTGSELGNLFYNVLGGVAGQSITTTHNSNFDLFSNIQSNAYWTETDAGFGDAWVLRLSDGYQYHRGQAANSYYAWAVHSGNVAGAVPVPAALYLFGSGLLGLVIQRRRKH